MLNIDRLEKVWKLTTSPNAGEAAAARERAKVMLAAHGKTLSDIPELLRKQKKAAAPKAGSGGFAYYDMNNPDHMAEYEKRDRTRRAERARKEAPERAAVLARYGGSVDAVLALSEREKLLKTAVAAWAVQEDAPYEHWTKSIDGRTRMDFDPPSDRVRRALSEAYPLPDTIPAAFSECQDWERRDRDHGLAVEDTSDTQLDLPAYLRQEIVRELLEHGLRARSVADVLVRQRYYLQDVHGSDAKIDEAVLADLEALALAETADRQPVQSGQRFEHPKSGEVKSDGPPIPAVSSLDTASARRAEVIRLLSNVDTAALSDRAIARRVGVSPQTVGNLRRKIGSGQLAPGR